MEQVRSNGPNADTGAGDYLEARMLAMVARAEAGERVPEAEHVLECEPADEGEWDALPPVAANWVWGWNGIWRADADAYSRWMSHRLRVATDEQLERIIEDDRT